MRGNYLGKNTASKSMVNPVKSVQKPKDANDTYTWIWVLAVIAIVLALFSNKAFNIDDPLFIWVAQHIRLHPLDFYGFSINWYGANKPITLIMENPPLASYFALLGIMLVGVSEVALHLFFLIPAVLLMAGTYLLARRWCSQPLMALLIASITPVLMVSATTIMCDILMLCFWVWAVLLWVKGIETNKQFPLILSALLICCSALSKYYGISLIPLLLVYTVFKKRKPGLWIVYMLGTIAVLWMYNVMTAKLYGHGLLTDAVSYAHNFKPALSVSPWLKGVLALSFAGGCLVTALFYFPFLASKRWLISIAVCTLMVTGVAALPGFWKQLSPLNPAFSMTALIQIGIFVFTGLGIVGLALYDVYKHRDADSVLLLLWILGTLAFAGFFNWTVNGRSILPMSPAMGIIIARRISEKKSTLFTRFAWLPILPAALISIMVTWSDYALANTTRATAQRIVRDYGSPIHTIWFQGHWGFQYYMENYGCKAFDVHHTELVRHKDFMILPMNNTNIHELKAGVFDQVEVILPTPCAFVITMQAANYAGFYSNGFGPLPYAFDRISPEVYMVDMIK